jgi:RimJ/RimL family protein N-acetyltransferase
MTDRPTLTDGDLVLRPMGPADAAAIWETFDDPEVARLTCTDTSRFTRERVDAFYARIPHDPTRRDYGIVEAARPERLLGEVVLNEIDPEAGSAHFRIAILRAEDRERGLGTRATRRLMAHAFDDLGLQRVVLEVYAFNPRARHVYAKLGFQVTEVRPDAATHAGETTDEIEMVLTPDTFVRDPGPPVS